MDVKLIDTAFWMPDTKKSSDEIAKWVDADAEFIKNKIGIKTRSFLNKDEGATMMALNAVNLLFNRNQNLLKEKIGLIIFVTQNPDVRLPHSAGFIQSAIGIPSCASFDISLGCSGFVYALSLAKGIMLTEGITDGLIITSDPYSKIMRPNDRATVSVFGDAAAATWISTDKDLSGGAIGASDLGTDGTGGKFLTIMGDNSNLSHSNIWSTNDYNLENRPHLFMDGREVFNFMMTKIPDSINNALEKNNLKIDDIDLFVFHQASKYMLQSLTRRCKIEPHKVPILLDDTANTISSSIPIVLNKLDVKSDTQSDKIILMSGFGVGLSWATTVMHHKNENE